MRPLSFTWVSQSPARIALVTTALAAVVLVAGCAAAAPASAPTSQPGTQPSTLVATAQTGSTGQAVAGPPALATVSGGGSGQATSTAGIAYPYPVYGNAPGLAPDQTIVVSGTGTATLKDASADRTSAERTALTAALADARSQAEIVASATGVKLGTIVSVSVSSSGGWFAPLPMESNTGAANGSSGGASSGPASPPAGGSVSGGGPASVVPATPGVTSIQIVVNVTVAYHFS